VSSEATTLRGTAHDAKGGAVVQTDEGRVVYVAGLAAWPDELRGRRVEVSGRLVREKRIPDPVVNERGEHSAGAYGDQEIVEDARWHALAR